jgi:hypothetical protein
MSSSNLPPNQPQELKGKPLVFELSSNRFAGKTGLITATNFNKANKVPAEYINHSF